MPRRGGGGPHSGTSCSVTVSGTCAWCLKCGSWWVRRPGRKIGKRTMSACEMTTYSSSSCEEGNAGKITCSEPLSIFKIISNFLVLSFECWMIDLMNELRMSWTVIMYNPRLCCTNKNKNKNTKSRGWTLLSRTTLCIVMMNIKVILDMYSSAQSLLHTSHSARRRERIKPCLLITYVLLKLGIMGTGLNFLFWVRRIVKQSTWALCRTFYAIKTERGQCMQELNPRSVFDLSNFDHF